MLGHFLLAFARNLRAHKAISLINVASLAVGLTVFAIAWLYVERELGYDRAWRNADRIHRLVLEQQGLPGSVDGFYTDVNPRAYPALRDYFPEDIRAITRTAATPVRFGAESDGGAYTLSLVDSAFASIFQFEMLEGSLEQVLQNPGMVAISERLIEPLGDQGRMGERIMLSSAFTGGMQEFEIGAVFREPPLSSVSFSMLAAIGEHAAALFPRPYTPAWESSIGVWLALRDGVRVEDFNAQMPFFIERAVTAFNEALPPGESVSEHLFYRFQPIADIHLNPVGFEANSPNFGDKAKVLTFAGVGLLVLLVGCCNSVSLSLAQVLNRRREIGVRKVCGASRGNVLRHFMGETVLLALLACVLALALQALVLAPLTSLLNLRGLSGPGWGDVSFLVGGAMLVGLVNGAYPAFVLSAVLPQSALRPGSAGGAKGPFRARILLVGAQFGLAVTFMSCAVALYAQLAVARAQPLGFEHRNLVMVGTPSSSTAPDADVLAQRLKQLPGVTGAIPTLSMPNQNFPPNINAVTLVRKGERESEAQATRVMVPDDFFELMEIPLVAGRPLYSARDAQIAAPTTEPGAPPGTHLAINRRAVEVLGFASPDETVGTTLFQRRADLEGVIRDFPALVVGVVEDSHYSSLHRRPIPEIYMVPPRYSTPSLLLRYAESAADGIERGVREVYREYGAQPNFLFIETRIDLAFLRERSEGRLLLIAAGLALFLSCIGLYGLAAATMARSVKEVGVRKVLGAGVGTVAGLFLWRFSRPVLLANVVAWPAAGWFVLRWIQQFPYQLDLNWLPPLFLGASFVVLAVAWITVGGVTVRAALGRPVQSLRYE